METADDRDAQDVEFANEMGRHLADRLLAPRLGISTVFRPKARARDVTWAAISAVTQYHSSRAPDTFIDPELDSPAAGRYESAVGQAIRTMSLSRRLGGVPVLAADAYNGAAGLTVVDVFHRPAIRSLMRYRESRVPAGFESTMPGPDSAAWPSLLRTVLPGLGGVALVDDRTAARGLVTSLLFNLRGFLKARAEEPSAPSCGDYYTVNCSNGYALEWFEEFRYAPTMFGDRRSSPVTDFLECGYYRFQATVGNVCVIDRGRHPNTPKKRSTFLKDV
jgi:hypothetical protein